jgi:putative pyruvate formate lyase activating enzyme
MSDFERLWVWGDDALERALAWYRAVALNRRPAKFRIARTIPLGLVPGEADEAALWRELERLTPVFAANWHSIRNARAPLGAPSPEPTLLDLCAELAWRMLQHCNFCHWNCRVDRSKAPGQTAGKLGACKLASESRVSTHFHHPGEEMVYRGTHGSGTIFFTSCNMRCAFCQNGDIATDKDNGVETSATTLAAMAWLLRMEGCHNVNWVGGDPTIHLHTIAEAIALLGNGFVPGQLDHAKALQTRADRFDGFAPAKRHGTYERAFNAPMLWNSNFYMTEEAMRLLRLLMDVWLPDFKFGPGRCAVTLARTPRYWESVTENLRLLRDWDEDFTIRHLVMPGHVECCTQPVLEWIAREVPAAPVNIMDQYRPENFCDTASAKYDPRHAALARRADRAEIEAACRHAQRLGLRFEALTYEKQRFGLPM